MLFINSPILNPSCSKKLKLIFLPGVIAFSTLLFVGREDYGVTTVVDSDDGLSAIISSLNLVHHSAVARDVGCSLLVVLFLGRLNVGGN